MADPVITPIVPPVIPPVVPWVDALEPEIKGHAQTRGWDKLEPAKAAAEAIKLFREAEKAQGIPVAEIARIPADPNDKAGWTALHSRLGVPADKAAYKLGDLKFADGETLDESFSTRMHNAVHAANLRPDQATAVVSEFMKYLDETEANDKAASATVAERELTKLKTAWGSNFDVNTRIVERAAGKLGITPENLSALSNVIGSSASMELLLKLGTAMGEARFITGENPGASGVMSVEQAQARKEELRRNTDFLKKYAAGDSAAVDEINNLDYIIVRARHAAR